MSPVGNDYDMEEGTERAVQELSAILNECFSVIQYEVIINPDRKWGQFWKPKTVLSKLEGGK